MSVTAAVVIQQIDQLLELHASLQSQSAHEDLSDIAGSDVIEMMTRVANAIRRFAPLGSAHRDGLETVAKRYGVLNNYTVRPLVGILRALRADYASGYLISVEELIHADLFSDFLEMADHLLSQGYKDPAAVVVGAVLEEHLRKLCVKHNIPVSSGTAPKKADLVNSELAAAQVYEKLDRKSVTAWLDLRNKAAHGQYDQYTKEQVSVMIDGVRHFIARHSA